MATHVDTAAKAAIVAALTAEYDATAPVTDEDDLIAAVCDYIASTQPLDMTALAEVAYAFVAGAEHATGHTTASRRAFVALRKAGLSL